MSADPTTVETRTTTTVAAGDDEHDGVIPEPGRGVSNLLWVLRQFVLGAGILWLLAILGLMVWTPDAPKGATDAATIVAVLGLLVNAFMQGFTRRQN